MPVTRSSGRHSSQQPSVPYGTRSATSSGSGDTKKPPKPPRNEIIVLSSDDDEPPPKGTLSSKTTSKHPSRKKTRMAASIPPSDVVEISSDDETHSEKPPGRKQPQSAEATVKDLRRTVRRLQEELKRSEQLLVSSTREVGELKRNCSSNEVLSRLGEHTSCEVCTLTMWCPYTLPQCGHSFCEDCLVDWFSTTQAQHMMANPQLDDNRAALGGQVQALLQMVPNLQAYGPHGPLHLRTVLAELRRHRPEYTCPSCRKEVLNKPVEDFRLKDLVREIAGMMGEKSSRKATPSSSHRRSGPFDAFFAAPMLTT